MLSDDLHPDFLRRKPIDISDEEWEQHRNQVNQIISGIRYCLGGRNIPRDIMDDLIHNAFVRVLERKGNPKWAGTVVAQNWLRSDDFKHKKRGKKVSHTPRVITYAELSTEDDDGKLLSFDPAEEDQLEWGNEDGKQDNLPINADRYKAIERFGRLSQQSPDDFTLVLKYVKRKYSTDNHFTRAESTAFESAMRRLSKLAQSN